ncbi:HpcH/HpaI aldolase family protein [Nocardiopsis ansamitocini]|uniref:2,4-dihydroxyhept-2-ene-1,7-dioic acid aldolase n=1 Tax=Nocardiopsis ansamitocini TaxID=1670832 RepID=A0A9W6UHX3_9ACTN|nr:aldolase/citrate lyase family protein [Nocardiopsis ansamitocini]GLU47089.1 2,4-dihydroxyhept-2-ene-1,7-dioic acid aldolase [Nocardiopsis ansamitocini]
MHHASTVIEDLKAGGTAVGYWAVLDSPVSTERVARTGYDYIGIDAQHGLMGYDGVLRNLMAIDAAHGPAGIVRVAANDPTVIGQALDAGALGVIVPLVNNAEEAEAAVRAARYPGRGIRSYGPMRSGLRVGPKPQDANAQTLLLVMIETEEGLRNVEEIAAVDGVDGLYIGPSDLMLAVGGAYPGDPESVDALEEAVTRTRDAAAAAGIVPAIHTPDGATARRRLDAGFRMVTIASELTHLEAVARGHLGDARG